MRRSYKSHKTGNRLFESVIVGVALFIFLIIIQGDEREKSEPVYAESPSSAFSQSAGRHTNDGISK